MLKKFKSISKTIFTSPLTYVLVGLFVLDIVSKWIIVKNFPLNSYETRSSVVIDLIPNFLQITRSQNIGSAFGFGNDSSGYRIFLIILRLVISIIIPVLVFTKGKNLKVRYKVAIVLVYAGCIGNFIDIAFYWKSNCGFDGVIDWIQFTFFPFTFNLADAYITVGVILLIILLIIDEVKEIKEKRKTGVYDLTPEEYEAKVREENKKKNGYSNNDNKKANK